MKTLLALLFLTMSISQPSLAQQNTKNIKKSKHRKKSIRKKKYKVKKRSSTLDYIDYTQGLISSSWIGFNHDFDMFFSGQRYKKTKNKSKIRLSYSISKSESGALTKEFDFGIRVHLPKISKKLSIVIEKQRDEILEAQTSQANKGVNNPDKGYTAGVKFLLKRTPFFTTSLDTGVKLKLPLDPFMKLKFFKLGEFKLLNTYFGQKFIFYRQEAFLRSITELNFSKRVNNTFSITQGNALTWTDETDDFTIRNFISLGQKINDKSGISYSVGASALLEPTYYYTGYDASINYRRKLYKDWLSGQTSLGSTFQKDNDFKSSMFINVRLSLLMK